MEILPSAHASFCPDWHMEKKNMFCFYIFFIFSFYRSFNKITQSGVFLVTFVLVRGGEKYLNDGLRNILLSFVLE